MKTYHKTFGQVEIIERNEKTTTLKVLATDEIKKLSTQFANQYISEIPFSDEQIDQIKLSTKTNKSINLNLIHVLAKKHNLIVVNYQGDFISLNFPKRTPKNENITDFGDGVIADFISDGMCNNFRLTGNVSFDEIKLLQPFFNDLKNA